ncbi:hypothetical protein YC2023_001467 [Brassica napus]
MGSMVLLELVRSVMNMFKVSRTIIKTKESDNEEATAPEYNRKVFMIFSKGFVNSEREAALRSRKMFPQKNKLKIQLYWVQSKRLLSPWALTTKHVISCSGSVWNRSRCNIWIASKDLLKEKRHLVKRNESRKIDLTRPRTKWRKASESAYPTNVLGSIVHERNQSKPE